MTMSLRCQGLYITNSGITDDEKQIILLDPAFNGTFLGTSELPEVCTYFRCASFNEQFLGAILAVPHNIHVIELHPALNTSRDYIHAIPKFLELAVMLTRFMGYQAFAVVPDFLPSVQLYCEKRHGLKGVQLDSMATFGTKESKSKVYVIPRTLQPQYVNNVVVTFN